MKRLFLSLTFFISTQPIFAQIPGSLKLWYRQPAGDSWTDALPVGNGRLGAMIYGNPDQEILKLNESTVWAGGPNRNDNPDALAALGHRSKTDFRG